MRLDAGVTDGKRGRATACAALVAAAAYETFGVVWWRARRGLGELAYDFYNLFYPNAAYALHALASGGSGLLWMPYQACGLPFLANTEVGLFYPGHLVFALLPRESALLASVLLHLAVAGVGAFLFCRELGAGAPAALCGALAFQLGQYVTQFAGWGPIHLSTYAWMPVAAWRAERLVRRTSGRNAVALAVVLALQLLAGFVQIAYYTYGLVALRVAWAASTREHRRPAGLACQAAVALALGLALAAIVLAPALEMARESVRGRGVLPRELGPGFSWRLVAETVRSQVTIPFNVLPVVLALPTVLALRRRGEGAVVAFLVLVVGGCVLLSPGPGSGVWRLYARLPLATSFRGAARVLWAANVAAAGLVALGADAIARRLPRAAPLLPLAVAADALLLGPVPYFGYRAGPLYDGHADAFAYVRARATPQDRVHVLGRPRDVSLGPKSPTWFRVPGIYDYEAETPRRYADYFGYLRTGHVLQGIDEWQWILDRPLPPTLQRPLFDRTAARYLLVAADADDVPTVFRSGIRRLADVGGVRVYENEQALPRARWVASAVSVPDDDVLTTLATGSVDPARTVVLPPGAAIGAASDPAARGAATITEDAPERVAVRVEAPAAGWLVLADVDYPGWTATVNGAASEVLRADYAFRAVAVPAGRSDVVFVYRAPMLRIGAALSLLALLVAAALARGRP